MLDKLIAGLEYGKFGLSFSSGCAALTCIAFLLKPGEHIVCCDDVYGGTQRFLKKVFEISTNVTVTFVDMTKLNEVEKEIKSNTRLIWIETPTNPTMKVCDI